MQKILLVLLLASQIRVAQAQSSGRTPPFLSKSFAGESVQSLESQTSGGNISVYGVPAAESRVEVYIYSDHGDGDLSKEEIQKRLDEQYTLTVSVTDHKLTASARPKERNNNNWRRGLSISFKIYVPVSCSSVLRTSGGNIALKKLSGTQDFKTSGGNLDIDGLSGKVSGRTSGGNIDITDSKDDIDLKTSGGNIDATHCEGNLNLGTSGGNLTLRLLKGMIKSTTSGGNVTGEEIDGELQAKTSGGNIRLRDLTCSLGASTSSGNLDVSFKQLGKFLTLTNSGGDINVQIPGDKGIDLRAYAERVKISSLANFKGDSDEHHVEGTVNGGGIPVRIDGSGGRINLNFK